MGNCVAPYAEGSILENMAQNYFSKGSEYELNELARAGEPLVRHFAALLAGGRPLDDYVQAGYEGFLKALKNYDKSFGSSFSTYAGHCIMGEIRHHIRREASYYKPVCIAELQKRADELVEHYFDEKGELPTLDYLSEELNVRKEGFEQAMRAGMVSLDEVDLSKISHVRYESFRFPIEDRITLEQAIKKLTDLQRKVIYMLFYRGMTQEEAAERLGLNQRKVSRILHGSLDSLKKDMQ